MSSSSSNQLIVPIVLWGRYPPSHCISSVFLSNNQKCIVTGCNDGQICIWDVLDSFKIIPRCLLFGHSASVLCLTSGSCTPGSALFVSSSESGEMCLWDMTDGRCLESRKLSYIHTNIQSYQLYGTAETLLFCNGYYAEILVMDALTLETRFTLSSNICPDWISTLHVLRPAKRSEDVVLALSASGLVKMWTLLPGHLPKPSEALYENESKPIKCQSALKLTCCSANQRTVLLICSKFWQIFDASDFVLLCSETNKVSERWSGGDFLSADRVIIWSDAGKAYLYKLPVNCIADSMAFHSQNKEQPYLYGLFEVPTSERLLCPPAMNYFPQHQVFLRGDSNGRIMAWKVPETVINGDRRDQPFSIAPFSSQSLLDAWNGMKPWPPGILDHMISGDSTESCLTATVYLPLQGRLVCGRDDGSIIIISISQTVMLQLLFGKHQSSSSLPSHQLLYGHHGRVTCLLYPRHHNERYELAHLVSGGADFSVCLWDLYAGALLHRFSVHAGEVRQLLVPPASSSNPRVLGCIASVAADHSVALLSLKERRCILLASRHHFPVCLVRWRPHDDFLVVGCADGSVFVWQIETGHLDRVVQGLVAEEILNACDDAAAGQLCPDSSGILNPKHHLFKGLRHGNFSAIRRGLHNLGNPKSSSGEPGSDPHGPSHSKTRTLPLMVQGVRANPKDPDSHVLFFNIEALIVQLLSDEYSSLSPEQLENKGLNSHSEYQKYIALSSSPENQHKFAGFFLKVKDTAGSVSTKLQAKAESVGFKTGSGEVTLGPKDGENDSSKLGKNQAPLVETNHTMEIARLLLSLLHSWGLDADLDRVCESKLGLLRPMRPVCFGLLGLKGGHMALLLPTFINALENVSMKPLERKDSITSLLGDSMPTGLVQEAQRAAEFAARGHWSLSSALTTHHLLSIIALANTLMSMDHATFIPPRHHSLAPRSSSHGENADKVLTGQQVQQTSGANTQTKQGWSLLAALHCVLLPELVKCPSCFKHPQVELLAQKWQDRCLEVREAAQALLLAELRRIGPKGRKALVDEWSPYLPDLSPSTTHSQIAPNQMQTNAPYQNNLQQQQQTAQQPTSPDQSQQESSHSSDEEDDVMAEEEQSLEDGRGKVQTASEHHRKKMVTAIILMGVIGAEYGHEVDQSRRKSDVDIKKKNVVDGFSLSNNSLARKTSEALVWQLLDAHNRNSHTSLRRAAIDLIGRGFTVWEPHLNTSEVLLGLLELCCHGNETPVPSMSYGLPLSGAADSCRTARHALSLIGTSRPQALITVLAREVQRYNALAQNPPPPSPQAVGSLPLHYVVLSRARPEILRLMDLLIEKMQSDVADLLVESMDIVLHCLDPTQLKNKGLNELFSAICRFRNVSYCKSTQRIAVGAKNGVLAIYEIKASKSQQIQAHAAAITATTFSPDGKYLATYSSPENKLCFWQTASGLFGLGNSQTRCVRTYTTKPMDSGKSFIRLVWVTHKTVVLMGSDNSQHQYQVT